MSICLGFGFCICKVNKYSPASFSLLTHCTRALELTPDVEMKTFTLENNNEDNWVAIVLSCCATRFCYCYHCSAAIKSMSMPKFESQSKPMLMPEPASKPVPVSSFCLRACSSLRTHTSPKAHLIPRHRACTSPKIPVSH